MKDNARKGLSKKLRFEVLKRDSFKCQYCGNSAPNVVLHIDHIIPVASGGTNDILNLVTSCFDCNSGKGKRQLDDDAVLNKKRNQLEELQERREQLSMMIEWQNSLLNIDEEINSELQAFWSTLAMGYNLTPHGKAELKKLTKKYGIDEIMEAMKIAAEKYLKYDGDYITSDSVANAFDKIGGICHRRKLINDYPLMADVYRVTSHLGYRFKGYKQYVALSDVKNAIAYGATADELIEVAKQCHSFYQFQESVDYFIDSQTDKGYTPDYSKIKM